jgi:hypothetical protein
MVQHIAALLYISKFLTLSLPSFLERQTEIQATFASELYIKRNHLPFIRKT